MKLVRSSDYALFVRALRLRIHNHETSRCACEFCDLARRLGVTAGRAAQ